MGEIEEEADRMSGRYAEDVVLRPWGINAHQVRKVFHRTSTTRSTSTYLEAVGI